MIYNKKLYFLTCYLICISLMRLYEIILIALVNVPFLYANDKCETETVTSEVVVATEKVTITVPGTCENPYPTMGYSSGNRYNKRPYQKNPYQRKKPYQKRPYQKKPYQNKDVVDDKTKMEDEKEDAEFLEDIDEFLKN
ncbi:hypothetical protein K502DRAFT_366126 [Neoconidiobolus thromboides FSU 785]|nr:hypothetical protein K502DRAFT_366126 [Neoconidiobolus thromboides FSU 785]